MNSQDVYRMGGGPLGHWNPRESQYSHINEMERLTKQCQEEHYQRVLALRREQDAKRK